MRYFLALLIFFSFYAPSAYALNSHSHNAKDDTKQHEHSWHKNHFSVFIGAMSPVDTADETSVALGFDYERRFTESLGLELLSDFAIGAHNRSVLFTTSVTWRPFRDYGLKLKTGPGFEVATHDGHKDGLSFVYSVGAAWEFVWKSITLTPTVHADFLGETHTNLTFGLSIGKGF